MKKMMILLSLALVTACGRLPGSLVQEGKEASKKVTTKIEDVSKKNKTPLGEDRLGTLNGGDIYLEGANHKEDPSKALPGINMFVGEKEISQLTEVGDYLVDYEMGGTMVRELLLKEDPFRYEKPAKFIEVDSERADMARRYFVYITEMNDFLSDNHVFDTEETNFTLVWAKKYKGTQKIAFYFREYFDKSLETTGNQGIVVLDESDRLIHYLSFGKRNPNALNHRPTWSDEEVDKALWTALDKELGGYIDGYTLKDFYYLVPAFEDRKDLDKGYKPQYVGEFWSKENIHTIYVRHDGSSGEESQ